MLNALSRGPFWGFKNPSCGGGFRNAQGRRPRPSVSGGLQEMRLRLKRFRVSPSLDTPIDRDTV